MSYSVTKNLATWSVHDARDGVCGAVGVENADGQIVAFAVDFFEDHVCEDASLDTRHVGLIVEALNVHEQTGLTPAQLQARVAELEGALREVVRLEQWEPENVWAHLSEWAE